MDAKEEQSHHGDEVMSSPSYKEEKGKEWRQERKEEGKKQIQTRHVSQTPDQNIYI